MKEALRKPLITYILSWVFCPGVTCLGIYVFNAIVFPSFLGWIVCLILTIVYTISCQEKIKENTDGVDYSNTANIVMSIISGLTLLLIIGLILLGFQH